jgi:hypothetical protein
MANFASQYVGTDKNNAVVDGWPEPGEAYPLPRGHKALYEVLEGAHFLGRFPADRLPDPPGENAGRKQNQPGPQEIIV